MRPARTLLLLALCVSSAFAGCFGASDDEPRLAVPTSEPPALPPRNDTFEEEQSRPRQPMEVNTSDPGYVIEGRWRKGDSWYYESDGSPRRYRWTTVLEVQEGADGRLTYIVQERAGLVGNMATTTLRVVVDGENWTRLRADSETTSVQFVPPAANLRFLRNGSFEYHERGTSTTGQSWNDRHVVNSVYASNQPVTLPWGTVTAGRIEHRDLILGSDGQERRVLHIRWMHRDYLNDVAYEIDNELYYRLIGARVNGIQYGTFPARA